MSKISHFVAFGLTKLSKGDIIHGYDKVPYNTEKPKRARRKDMELLIIVVAVAVLATVVRAARRNGQAVDNMGERGYTLEWERVNGRPR